MKLFKHQQNIINDDPKKCGLFLGTGSSKTRTALELAEGKILVIAPKTQVLDKNWQRENKKWNLNKDLTIMSKENVRRDFLDIPYYDTVILDEADTMAGVTTSIKYVKKIPMIKSSQTFDAIKFYIKTNNPKRLYLLTATPTRSAMCVYGLATLLGKDLNYYQFRDEYYFKRERFYMAKKDVNTQNKLAKLVQSLGYVGRLQDYFDIPEQNYKNIFVDLSAAQKKRLKELPLERPEPLVLLTKKLQVENGVLSGDEYNKAEIFDNGKIEAIINYAIEFPKIIIFSRYLLQIEEIKKALEKEGKNVYVMTGNVKDRGAVLEEVNKSENYVFIVSAQISAGWELPECPVMIFASRTYGIADYIQGQGRILRSNALKKNLYINLIAKGDTVDNAVHEALENKIDFSEKIYLKI